MCYILGSCEVFREELKIEANYIDYVNKMANYSNLDWNTDEKYFYQTTLLSKNLVVLRDRNFKMRVDRGNWAYNEKKLREGYYIDSHLLRPYKMYQEYIKKIII